MRLVRTRWQSLFLFCLGITIATGFIMEWLASDFWVGNEKFSILGLELFYSKKVMLTVLTQMKQPSRIALNYHLIFDFVFMAGVYPGIASLCMIAKEKTTRRSIQHILFAFAALQPVAWVFDIVENSYLLMWTAGSGIGEEFSVYHNIVAAKWLIALIGGFCAITTRLFNKLIDQKNRKS